MPDTAPPPLKPELEAPSLPEAYELRTIFLGGLLFLVVRAVCYAAAEIVLPIVLAFVLNLVFQPVLRALERVRVPRLAAAIIIVASLVVLFVGLGLLLATPLSTW